MASAIPLPFCRCRLSPFPRALRKFRKNYVSAVRIALPAWKIPLRGVAVATCHCAVIAVPYSNTIESYFCRSAVGCTTNQRSGIWSHSYVQAYGKTFPAFPFSPATATVAKRNGRTTTVQRTERHKRQNGNGMVETRHNDPDPDPDHIELIQFTRS